MKTFLEQVKKRLKAAAVSTFGDELNDFEPVIDAASNPAFGDYQTNIAMVLASKVAQPPRTVAQKLIAAVDLSDWCQTPEVAGPGFINLRLKKEYLESLLDSIKDDTRIGIPLASPASKIVIDMSSPNIAKEMHVGHLRSTIIGDALARTFSFLGHDVLKINHVGDWGTQFGMLIAHLKDACPSALSEPDKVNLGDLVEFYKEARKNFDASEEFQNSSRQEVVALQSGNPESIQAWQLICNQSRKAFQEIYSLLDVPDLIERGESFYNSMLPDVVSDLKSCGLLVEDQGAQCVFLDGFLNEQGEPLPFIVKKRDGGFNYATTDLAGIRHRVKEDHADELIYVVGAGQSAHFAQLQQVARKAGWLPEHVKMGHVPFGSVLGEGGKKLQTRSGETVRLKDLLDEAVASARAELEGRLKDEQRSESEEFISQVAQAVGIAAVKYADLSLNRITNYIFSFKKMLSLQGNTAPYMMYAYVRVQGISRKGGIDFTKLDNSECLKLSKDAEVTLAKCLLKFDEVIDSVVQDLMPNRICEYLFQLSQVFNQFYENCPVLNADEPARTSRLLLCDLTARTLKVGLSLLGIPLVERM